jgi:exopolysaccharide biosynthesis polyprenyl glycosylphosphotransferase
VITSPDFDLIQERRVAEASARVVEVAPEPVLVPEQGRAVVNSLFRSAVNPRVRSIRPHAWLLLLAGDVIGLGGPALLRHDGRAALLGMALVAIVLLHQAGMYRSRLHLSVLDDMPKLIGRDLVAAGIACTAVAVLDLKPPLTILVGYVVLVIAFHLLLRFCIYRGIGFLRAKGVTSYRTLIVGGGVVAGQIAATLHEHPQYGLRAMGFLDVDPLMDSVSLGRVAQLGDVADLGRTIEELDIQVIIVAFANLPDSAMIDVLRNTDVTGRDVFIIPRLHEAYAQPEGFDHIGAIPVVRVRRPRNGLSWHIKRAIDVAVSAIALLILSPVLLAVCAAVRLEGGPGILFRQTRVGRDGENFELLKFRSMKPVDETESSTRWNVSEDNRIGRVGRFIRRTSLDELPQLINILRGEMSLVGPRPERPYFVEQFSAEHPRYFHRHRVPCGLTGLAQINGLRGDTSIVDRARYDNYYIENWSLWLDVKIMLSTVHEVLGGRGA